MTAPPYTSDDGSIVYGKCYASYVRSISDRDGDPDPYPDIDLLNGSVKFESVFDGQGARPALPLPAIPRTKGIVISGDTYEVKASNLVDKESREGVWLVVSVDGIPLTWRATVTLADERNKVVLNTSYILVEDTWEIELDGRKVVNLPDLIPNPGALTPAEGSALRAAQQTLDEIRVLKGLIDATKLGVDSSASSALTSRNEAQGFRNEAEGFKSTASSQAGAASTSRNEALGFRNEAEGFKNTAGTSAGAANTSRNEALGFRNEAEGFRNQANEAKLSWKGPWSAATAYIIRDVVSHGGSSWWAKAASTGTTPVEGATWSLLASRGAEGPVATSASSLTGALTSQVDTSASMATVAGEPAKSITTWLDSFKVGIAGLNGSLSAKADLDGAGKLQSSQLPALAITEFLGVVATQAAMLALSGQRGDWCVRSDTNTQWILIADNPAVVGSWRQMVTPASPVTSVAGRTGAITLSKTDVGLSNVDNTSDANKPISSAVSTALGTKAATSHTHTPESIGAEPASWVGTQAQYDAIVTKDSSRTYNIIEG